MMIGVIIPVLTNFTGLVDAVNSFRSQRHRLQFCIIDNSKVKHGVAQSWNIGAKFLFSQGAKGVIIANDDILCSPFTVDKVVDAQERTKALLTTGHNLRDQIEPLDILTMIEPPKEELVPFPDFSFFYLPKLTFMKIGLFDENFKPAYFEDNDYHARVVLSGGTALRSVAAAYYHFGSKTQNEAESPVVPSNVFLTNKEYFELKWGCSPVNEEGRMKDVYFPTPFNDPLYTICDWPQF